MRNPARMSGTRPVRQRPLREELRSWKPSSSGRATAAWCHPSPKGPAGTGSYDSK
ncbi:hypothetical protein [Streptomyces sp. NPDC057557]|uniref:hypothetical protein n=1 Tax=Streptomyces sp. NPDC057557 TaxID=3346167 RepID=UPI0036C39AAA